MTARQRILSSLKGKPTDRICWSPFLAYFWEYQHREIQEKGKVQFLEEIGADPLIRGAENILPVDIHYGKSRISMSGKGKEIHKTYETPAGTINEVWMQAPGTLFLKEHAIKTPEDLKVLQYLHEDMYFTENFTELNEKMNLYGEKALMVPIVGVNRKTAFQALLEQWFGTEALVYAVYDYEDEINQCLASMRRASMDYLEIAVESDSEAFISWEDTSTTNINPTWFSKYIAPEINDWCRLIHKKEKLYIHHACGHLRDLIDLIGETDIDVLESISPPPTGNITLKEARDRLPERIALVGGIEPVQFEQESIEFLEDYVYQLLEDMKGSRYVLANSDSCPPGVSIEKFQSISRIAREHNL